jgi:hypothetical protein
VLCYGNFIAVQPIGIATRVPHRGVHPHQHVVIASAAAFFSTLRTSPTLESTCHVKNDIKEAEAVPLQDHLDRRQSR